MNVRDIRPDDIPHLYRMFESQGFEYTFPDLAQMEAVKVVTDGNDIPLCAVAAERTVQLYFLADNFGPPHARLHAIGLLHVAMATTLKSLGYNEADAYIPPQIDERFGRWLVRRFGWVRNWKSWSVRF